MAGQSLSLRAAVAALCLLAACDEDELYDGAFTMPVTAGVLKVIAAVRAAEDGGGKTTTKGKKRAQAAPPADSAPQKKISSFFAKPKACGA